MRYPGGKGRTFRQIINMIPPHRVYVETHLGGGAVLRHKRPAELSIGVDLDRAVVETWRGRASPRLKVYRRDAVSFLNAFDFDGDEFVFCDPPYHPSTRRRARVYRHDYSEADHEMLLDTLVRLPCMVLVVGYPCDLYEKRLESWRSSALLGASHAGRRHERAWMNYELSSLHDYRYLGVDYSERQRIRRKRDRLLARLERMPILERNALVAAISRKYG